METVSTQSFTAEDAEVAENLPGFYLCVLCVLCGKLRGGFTLFLLLSFLPPPYSRRSGPHLSARVDMCFVIFSY